MTTPRHDSLDEPLRVAQRHGRVIVYRGEWPAVEVDVVAIDGRLYSDEDPYADACRRAFAAKETG